MSSGAGAFGAYTREQLRQSYAEAWRKSRERRPLTPLEALIADVIALHCEYQPLLEDTQAAIDFEPRGDAENPFLHMGLHLAVREQVSIDRPPGVRELERALAARVGDEHGAEHVLMEALAETLWEAQRSAHAPDESRYLDIARARLRMLESR